MKYIKVTQHGLDEAIRPPGLWDFVSTQTILLAGQTPIVLVTWSQERNE